LRPRVPPYFSADIIFPAVSGRVIGFPPASSQIPEIGFSVAPARAAVFFGGYYFPGRFWGASSFSRGFFYSEARAALFFWRILFSRSFLGASSFSRGGQTVRQKAWWRGDAHSSTWARALVGTR